jgi:uncharacterized protein YidB (DUF937 family)
MGLLDGLIGGALGAGAFQLVSKVINDHGGLQGVLDQFQKQGLGGTVQSWLGQGDNHPITPDHVTQAIGADKLGQMAAQAGVSSEEMAAQLAQHLPTVVDKLTPDGKVPAGNPLAEHL